MTNFKSAKPKRPMMVLDASSMLCIKGGKRRKAKKSSGAAPPDM